MNKRGSGIFLMLMLGVLFFIIGLALAPALKDVSDEARAADQLDCDNETITDQNKAVCTSVDIQQFLYTGTIFGLAGLLLGRVALG